MVLDKEEKAEIISEYRINEKDVGSAEVQAAVLSRRIQDLSVHMKQTPKDVHSRRGLVSMVAKRRKLLNYIKRNKPGIYPDLIQKLGLRK